MVLFVDALQEFDGEFKINNLVNIPCITNGKMRNKKINILYEISGFTLSDKISSVGNLKFEHKTTFSLYSVGSYEKFFYRRIGYLPIQNMPDCYVSVWEKSFIIAFFRKVIKKIKK